MGKLLCLLLFIGIVGCKEIHHQQGEISQLSISEAGKSPTKFLYKDNASIDYVEDSLEPFPFTPYTISPGFKTIFVYFYQKQPGVFDGHYSERVMFEINNKLDSFYYQNKEILNVRCSDRWISAWGESDSSAFRIEKGYIKGKKLASDKWRIDLKLINFDSWSDKDRVTEVHQPQCISGNLVPPIKIRDFTFTSLSDAV